MTEHTESGREVVSRAANSDDDDDDDNEEEASFWYQPLDETAFFLV